MSIAASEGSGRLRVPFDLGSVGLELLRLDLLRLLHRVLDLRLHVGDTDDDEFRRALVERLARFLQVLAAHARGRVPRNGTEHGATSGSGCEQTASDRSRREECDDQTGRETEAAAHHSAYARRCLVLLDDLDL